MTRSFKIGIWVASLVTMAGIATAISFTFQAGPRLSKHDASLSPKKAEANLQLAPGLRITTIAAEPLIADPVAFCFDERGRLYVVEDRGYPGPIDGSDTHEGRVVLLEDTHHDGVYDKRTVFAAGMTFPNGIMPWRGGVFVTCAPDIIYFKDTKGSGVADVRRVVLTGFQHRTPQNMASHPTLGLDGKVYITCGYRSGGSVTSPEHPERPAVKFTPEDSRFDPDTFAFETTGGTSQFGLSIDAFGHRFVCSNEHPVLEVVLGTQDLRRNPLLPFSDTMQEVSKVGRDAKVIPISKVSTTADFLPELIATPHKGTFTSACGICVYGGSGLPADEDGDVFICEPAQNLVQRQKLEAQGASFRSTPVVTNGREFLSSTDTWFRPVFLANGPGGGLYLADMNRAQIDLPRFYPPEVRQHLDFYAGETTGRIYRILQAGATVSIPDFAGATPGQLCRLLESPDSWTRETARRLLLERHETGVVPALERCATAAPLAESRVCALWTLTNLGKLSGQTVMADLSDRDPRVREQAARVATTLSPSEPDLKARLVANASDADAHVRFATALALAGIDGDEAVRGLARIAVRDGNDPWTRAAVLSGVGPRMEAFMNAVLAERNPDPAAYAATIAGVGRLLGIGSSMETCTRFVERLATTQESLGPKIAAILGLAEGLQMRRGANQKSSHNLLAELMAGSPGSGVALIRQAAALAGSRGAPEEQRIDSIRLLGYADFTQGGDSLGRCLDPAESPEIEIAAIGALSNLDDPRAGDVLIDPARWVHYTPQIKRAAIAALISGRHFRNALLTALVQGSIKAPDIPPPQRERLQNDPDPAVRARARSVLASLGGDRMRVYKSYLDVLKLEGSAAKGEKVFRGICAACHTYDGFGAKVGPDLTGIGNQPSEALLLNILVPNYSIAAGYDTMTVSTRDGQSTSGWIVSESDGSVMLRTATGADVTILRGSIRSITAAGVSLMPDGLEQTMSKQDLSNLVAYLKSGGVR